MALTRSGINYLASTGTGPAVVFLHGVTLDSRMWSAQVAAYADRWRCITVDLRGHGRSAPLEPGYDPAADLLEVLEESDTGLCTVVGLSLGGYEAVVFAALHPEHCGGVLLVDAWIPGPVLAGWEPPFRLAREAGADAAREAWLADPLFAAARCQPETFASLKEMVSHNDLRIWTGQVQRATRPSLRELAARIQAPTQVMVGAEDLPGFKGAAAWLVATIPGSAGRPLKTLKNAGHLAPMETPEVFNQELSAFVNSLHPLSGG